MTVTAWSRQRLAGCPARRTISRSRCFVLRRSSSSPTRRSGFRPSALLVVPVELALIQLPGTALGSPVCRLQAQVVAALGILASPRRQIHSMDGNGDVDHGSAAYQGALELCAIHTWSKVLYYGYFDFLPSYSYGSSRVYASADRSNTARNHRLIQAQRHCKQQIGLCPYQSRDVRLTGCCQNSH